MTPIDTNDEWRNLIDRYLNKTISASELDRLLHLVNMPDNMPGFDAIMEEKWKEAETAGISSGPNWNKKWNEYFGHQQEPAEQTAAVPFYRKGFWKYAVAAVLLVTAGWWIWRISIPGKQPALSPIVADIEPGKNRATLTLANGAVIDLDSAANGTLASQQGGTVSKENGTIVYHPEKANGSTAFNTLKTPRGGQYRLTLPDGTKVWLNAASSIRYPVVFATAERLVEIKGEAYLEVADNSRIPFKVKMENGNSIEVLGTSFNVNAYADEPTITTTLLTGKVRVSNVEASTLLEEGQQASIGQKIRINPKANTEQAIAWKNGAFDIDNKTTEEVMRELARWYDVEVIYESEIPIKKFGGQIGRQLTLLQCTKILQGMGLHCRLEEGRRLIVLSK